MMKRWWNYIIYCLVTAVICSCNTDEGSLPVAPRMTTICDLSGNPDNPWKMKSISEFELAAYLSSGALQPGNTVPGKPVGTLLNNFCQEVTLQTVNFDNGIIYIQPDDNYGESGLPWSITYNITGAKIINRTVGLKYLPAGNRNWVLKT